MNYETRSFRFGEHTLVYDSYGEGDRLIVYVHGLLLDAEMNRGLAEDLACQGFRVILLDLVGHGRSDMPAHASQHRMDSYADQVVALLDHLGFEQAVVGGVSLGANVSLFMGTQNPERLRGLIIEMPVLEQAVPMAALAFIPLMIVSHYGRVVLKPLGSLLRRLPDTPVGALTSFVHGIAMDPSARAAVLHGLITGPVTPTQEDRAKMTVPTLVIGHRFDPIHAFNDADNLADLLPDATLVRANSMIELRLFPERITNLMAQFAAERWDDGARVPTTAGEQPHRTIDLDATALDARAAVGEAKAARRISESSPKN